MKGLNIGVRMGVEVEIWNYTRAMTELDSPLIAMDSPSLPMDVRDINVCLLSAKKKSTSLPSLGELDQMSMR